MKIAGTGHRPDKISLNGKNAYDQAVYNRLIDLAEAFLKKHSPTQVISGMALGWDMALAEASLRLDIPLHAYVPHDGHESRWPTHSRARYHSILVRAQEVKIVCPGEYAPWKMQKRNEAMVDALTDPEDVLVAMWNGSSGGTDNCLKYAKKKFATRPKVYVNLWHSWLRYAQQEQEQSASRNI